jgi:flagellin
MSVSINTNMSAIMAANNLSNTNAQLQNAITELSSGSKLVNPQDDPGGLAVSMSLTAEDGRSTAVSNNIADSQSYLQTQDGALSVAGNVLTQISELQTEFQDPTKSASDLADYNTEFTQLQSELTSIGAEKFNGTALFATALTTEVSEDGSQTVSLSSKDLLGNASVTAITGAASLAAVTETETASAVSAVGTMRAANGAEQTRLGFASDLLTANQTNIEAANSAISDVDVASESTQLARYSVLQQAGTSMLAQANQSSQTVLKLLQ